MKLNTVVAVGALIAVALVGIVSLNGRGTQAADPPKAAAEVVGRYQIIIDKEGRNVLCDTATGRVFVVNHRKQGGAEWMEIVEAVKQK